MNEVTFDEEKCVLCEKAFSDDDKSTSVTKGLENLIKWSNTRKDIVLENHLSSQKKKSPQGKVLVHSNCRREYVDPRRPIKVKRSAPSEPPSTPKRQKLRSSQPTFRWKEHCFYCDSKVIFDDKHPNRYPNSRRVGGKPESVNMIHQVRNRCDERNEEFASVVKKRLSVINDLVAVEAVYHSPCQSRFFSSDRTLTSESSRGRNESDAKLAAFKTLCEWLDEQTELYTLQDLHDKMIELSGEATYVCATKWIKKKLEDKYGDYIFIAEVSGRKNAACFRNLASMIINDKWYEERHTDVKNEANRIIDTAAKLIKNRLRLAAHKNEKYTMDTFPSVEDATKIGWIPNELRRFLGSMINSELKVESIGQCMRAAMPRSVLPPILFSLSVQIKMAYLFLFNRLSTENMSMNILEFQKTKIN